MALQAGASHALLDVSTCTNRLRFSARPVRSTPCAATHQRGCRTARRAQQTPWARHGRWRIALGGRQRKMPFGIPVRQTEDGSPMSPRQIHDEALTLLLAGHETTALALSWTWYLLAQHPHVAAAM